MGKINSVLENSNSDVFEITNLLKNLDGDELKIARRMFQMIADGHLAELEEDLQQRHG